MRLLLLVGLSHLAALQQFEALIAIPGIVPRMVTVRLLLRHRT